MMRNLLSYRNAISLLAAGILFLATLGFTSAAVAQSSCGALYVVQRGDDLLKIARTCGVSYTDLLKANTLITNPSLAYTGQVINIPAVIQFGAGGTAAILQGHLAASSKQYYLLNAGAGQTLDVTLSAPSAITLAILGADGIKVKSADSNLSFRGILPKTQEYVLTLASGANATDYSLSVDIPARIRFVPGGTSATMTGAIPANLSQFYILSAAQGQTLNVTATPQGQLQLTIYGVDGSVLRSGMGQGAAFAEALPSTQDYILQLRSPTPNQAFTLTVSIPASGTVPGSGIYTVQRGDTLFRIALHFHTTVSALLRANPQIVDPDLIFPGQQIKIP